MVGILVNLKSWRLDGKFDGVTKTFNLSSMVREALLPKDLELCLENTLSSSIMFFKNQVLYDIKLDL